MSGSEWEVESGEGRGKSGEQDSSHSPHPTPHSAAAEPEGPSAAPLTVEKPEDIRLRDPVCGSGQHSSHSPHPTPHSAAAEPEGPSAAPLTVEKPEDIRFLDPACGSGHMLTYAFDLLVKIYEEEGYAPSEIPALILRHNLHGLEICPRAAQLAQFALLCKAREKSRASFRRPVQPQVMCLRDVVITPNEIKGFTDATGVAFTKNELAQIHQFRENTGTFGALIQPVLDGEGLAALKAKIGKQAPAGDLLLQNTHRKLLAVLDQAEMLSQRYHVVVANPPYMGWKGMASDLKSFLESHYDESKADLFSAFIVKCLALPAAGGLTGMVTMHGWMFLPTFKELRPYLRKRFNLVTLAHLGARGFDTISGEVVQTAAFVYSTEPPKDQLTEFQRLVDGKSEDEKSKAFLEGQHVHRIAVSRFKSIATEPLLYWLPPMTIATFGSNLVSDVAKSGGRCKTHNDSQFVRNLSEVSASSVFHQGKWKFLEHGGEFRKWFGSRGIVFDWSPEAKAVYEESGGLSNSKYWDTEGISWSDIGSGSKGFRLKLCDSEYSSLSPTLIPNDPAETMCLLGLLNTPLTSLLANALNPSIHVNVGDALRLPYRRVEGAGALAAFAVNLARADWDNFETSWDFRDFPLLRSGECGVESGDSESFHSPLPTSPFLKGPTLAESWQNYAAYSTAAINRMRELETENNRLWIEAYGLQDELSPEVPLEEITLTCNPAYRYRGDATAEEKEARHRSDTVKEFLSYAIGCMMGRYSLDVPGLVLANAGDTLDDYWRIVREKYELGMMNDEEKPAAAADPNFILHNSSFIPDQDGILPILDGEWFEDDVVARTREFLRVTFGEATLNENLRFIEDSLGKPLEKYFLTDFYKDHLQTYKKRPIYWLFQSPKKGFGALVYLHRYNRDSVNTLLNNYLRDYLKKLESRLEHLVRIEATGQTTREKTAARKEAERLRKAQRDCQQWERDVILPLAQQRLEIDLDDGVKANYPKFGKALAPIPGLMPSGKEVGGPRPARPSV